MTQNSRSPAFVILDYHSPFAPHKQQFCLKDWFPPSTGHDFGTCTAHDSSSADVGDMITRLVDKIKVFAKTDTIWDLGTVFTQALPVGPAFARASGPLGVAGVNTGGAPRKATEFTLVMRSSGFAIAKLVALDVPVSSEFEPILPGSFPSSITDFLAEFGAITNGWVAQDGNQITQGVKATYNLNQKLRKEYRMT
jgi:hypothetical protein